jgi:hypothetical protein
VAVLRDRHRTRSTLPQKKFPSLKGLTTEDAAWNLDIFLDQLTYIYALNQWPLLKGPATYESLDEVISNLVRDMGDNGYFATMGGRLVAFRNSAAPNCVELSLQIGHLDFTDAIEARDAK